MFGRPPVPKRALIAATLGAVYALLILPDPASPLGLAWGGISWFLISLGLLFVTELAYHVFTFWGILWMVYRGVSFFRAGATEYLTLVLDLIFPIAALTFLISSRYVQVARG